MNLLPGEKIIKKGFFLYNGSVECDIRVVYIRFDMALVIKKTVMISVRTK